MFCSRSLTISSWRAAIRSDAGSASPGCPAPGLVSRGTLVGASFDSASRGGTRGSGRLGSDPMAAGANTGTGGGGVRLPCMCMSCICIAVPVL